MTDLDYIKLVQQGDRDAFAHLVRLYEKKVYNIALRMCQNPEDANDVSQEVFLRVYRSIHSFKGESTFSTYLYRVAVNLSIDFMRKNRRRQGDVSLYQGEDGEEYELNLPDRSGSPEELAERREQRRALLGCIAALPERHRQMIVLRDLSGLSYDEIARVMQCNEGTVKSRISRAREALRRELVKNGNFFPAGKSKGV
ncbi:RNA polymerase sigma factor [Feifania hominis]|uniref:RNA polymerase sigma factor n=1 Tax=Feifania hominis TaxID=2763660 RepID=UPI0020166334